MRSFVYLCRSFVFVHTRLCLSALPLLCVFPCMMAEAGQVFKGCPGYMCFTGVLWKNKSL